MKQFRISRLNRFARDEKAAVLVEFALVFPLMLAFLAFTSEFARLFWAYQVGVAGVRDASRYLGRVVAVDYCVTYPGATNVALTAEKSKVEDIIQKNLDNTEIVFQNAITSFSATPTVSCAAGSYRIPQVPVATVTATFDLPVPMVGMFRMVFPNFPESFTAQVRDKARVFGA